ncbi:MAG: sulfotransferase [Planctomycetaceae bacterium]
MKRSFATNEPVFMIGHGSSGTSILATLLREQFGIAFGTESQFIVDYHKRLHRYGDLDDERNLRHLVSHILSERFFRRSAKFGFRTDVKSILGCMQERSYRGVLEAVFGEFARQLGMSRWGDKTPAYNRNLDVIGTLFPNARYLHMIRDGRDVALSVFRRYWGHKNVYMAATDWRDEIDMIDRFVETLPPDRILEVKYEELLSEPVDTMRRLAKFLGLSDPDGSILTEIERTVPGRLDRANFDKWRQEWPSSRRLAYERIACDQLRRHGYETVLDTPAVEAGAIARAFWYCDDKLKKWTYADYWRDNAYKARWHGRNALRALTARRTLDVR